MGENNKLKGTVEELFRGMDGVISSKTVVGDAIHIDDTIIVPLVDVSFAIGAGSFQGDKKIVEICEKIVYNKNGGLRPFDLDCSDIPDLVPVLTVLGSFCEGKSYIRNAARLRIKECDRLSAISQCLNAIGGKVTELEDGLEIEGVGSLNGGEVDSFNDHRIAMSMAVAATRCTSPLKINGAECVSKSYPDFFKVYESIGGEISREP